jgi:hypothetical protein
MANFLRGAIAMVILSLIVALLLGTAGNALADTIVITSGHVSTYAGGDLAGWQLLGDRTLLVGENFGSAPSFRSGVPVDLSQVIGIYQNPTAPRAEQVAGAEYSRVFLTGSFSFAAEPFTAPTAPQNTFRTFQTPFTMVGHVTGFGTPAFDGAPLFSVDLTGRGTAVAGDMRAIADENGTDWLNRCCLVFNFSDSQAASPTPEPGTFVLFASAIAIAAVRRARRR